MTNSNHHRAFHNGTGKTCGLETTGKGRVFTRGSSGKGVGRRGRGSRAGRRRCCKQGFSRCELVCSGLSFVIPLGLLNFSGIFQIFSFASFSAYASTYKEHSQRDPRHNQDLSQKKWETHCSPSLNFLEILRVQSPSKIRHMIRRKYFEIIACQRVDRSYWISEMSGWRVILG